ncbi:MAG: PKD domain-containing protein, partial [Pedobacter sp.]
MNKIKRLFLLFATFILLAGVVYAVEQRINKLATVSEKSPKKIYALIIEKRCLTGNQVELFTTASGADLQWQKDRVDITGEKASTYRPTTSGVYRLVNATETSDEITLNFDVPTASFTQNSSGNACGTETVTFTNTSTNGETYLWEFGDGQISTDKNPVHEFNALLGAGIQEFKVTLTVTSARCQSSMPFEQVVKIKQRPDAKFDDFESATPFTNCQSSSDVFNLKLTNSSSTRSINTKYEIDWGDGTTRVETSDWTSLTHSYTSSKYYDLTVKVTANNGCESIFRQKVYNGSNPKIESGNPGNTQSCGPVTYTFPINGTEGNPPGTIYTVSYNDGSPDEIYNTAPTSISHTFTKSSCGATTPNGAQNAFYVRITASNPCGSSTITVEPIRISMQPIASMVLRSSVACVGSTVDVTNDSQSGGFISGTSCSSSTRQNWVITPST